MNNLKNILLVDDEEDLCMVLQKSIERMGYNCDFCYSLSQAKRKLSMYKYDAVLTDMNIQGENGLDLVTHVIEAYPTTPIAVISAYGDAKISIDALKLGAFDFVSKPIDNDNLKLVLEKALVQSGIEDQLISQNAEVLNTLIGESSVIREMKKRLVKISKGQAPIFIQGESGSGKEVVAGVIHQLSVRKHGPFVAINCGAIPEDLLESELFGHKKGSFTGATADKVGLIQSANGGTLFLDEIAELPLTMQVKILRAVQEKKIRPLGYEKEISVDFRLVSATHQNMEKLVQEGKFRHDLYFRLHVMDVSVPPLRERGADIILLAEYFCSKICSDWDMPEKKLSSEVNSWLVSYSFPGNVRELQNIIQRAITLSDTSLIVLKDMDVYSQSSQHGLKFSVNLSGGSHDSGNQSFQISVNAPRDGSFTENLQDVLPGKIEDVVPLVLGSNLLAGIQLIPEEGLEMHILNYERKMIEEALRLANGRQTDAAKILKMKLRSFRYRLERLGLDSAEYKP